MNLTNLIALIMALQLFIFGQGLYHREQDNNLDFNITVFLTDFHERTYGNFSAFFQKKTNELSINQAIELKNADGISIIINKFLDLITYTLYFTSETVIKLGYDNPSFKNLTKYTVYIGAYVIIFFLLTSIELITKLVMVAYCFVDFIKDLFIQRKKKIKEKNE